MWLIVGFLGVRDLTFYPWWKGNRRERRGRKRKVDFYFCFTDTFSK
jgi:hypothetical protein